MKAAVLEDLDKGLQVKDVPEPDLRPDAVIIRLIAAFIPGAMLELIKRETRGTDTMAASTTALYPWRGCDWSD